jgi:hypothetical protein
VPNRYGLARREVDSPKAFRALVLVDELNSVGALPLYFLEMRYDTRRELCPAFVLQYNSRSHGKLAVQLNCGAMAIEVGRPRWNRERTLLTVLAGKSYWGAERHAITAAFGRSKTANDSRIIHRKILGLKPQK